MTKRCVGFLEQLDSKILVYFVYLITVFLTVTSFAIIMPYEQMVVGGDGAVGAVYTEARELIIAAFANGTNRFAMHATLLCNNP
ncbi:unnamed protein product [Nippostrongylus brasiliensis]|uniref:PGG domain-containing protein n=1 Tax=Nippostrongylus brasiliensis TaxID=27835 RepID=A0A0N4Y4K1_NIPBR|nr:unnamed protein product [Nippostrongylus brasiliensis]